MHMFSSIVLNILMNQMESILPILKTNGVIFKVHFLDIEKKLQESINESDSVYEEYCNKFL
jgi:hypothetical protein